MRPGSARSTASGVDGSQEMKDARAYATWAAMEREFALGEANSGRRLLLPRHSRARFLELVEWMARDEGRRGLLPEVLRATGIYVRRTQLTNWGQDQQVRRRVAELSSGAG